MGNKTPKTEHRVRCPTDGNAFNLFNGVIFTVEKCIAFLGNISFDLCDLNTIVDAALRYEYDSKLNTNRDDGTPSTFRHSTHHTNMPELDASAYTVYCLLD